MGESRERSARRKPPLLATTNAYLVKVASALLASLLSRFARNAPRDEHVRSLR